MGSCEACTQHPATRKRRIDGVRWNLCGSCDIHAARGLPIGLKVN